MAKVKLSRNEIICRALDKADAGLDTAIQDASWSKEALEYLRLKVLTQAERGIEFASVPDEDGPCAGFGCETVLIS